MPPKKKVASFGFESAFDTSPDLPKVIELDVENLEPNPDQPRKHFDEAALQELADSIAAHGLLQPITVKPIPDSSRFMIVAGERRWRAHQLAGKARIFAIQTDGNADELALIENIQRQNLDPIEEAEAYGRMMQRHGYTQEELARVVNKARRTIGELLSLNELPATIKSEWRTSAIRTPKSVLIEIARLTDSDKQLSLWEEAKQGRITVRATREKKEKERKPQQQQRSSYTRIKWALKRLADELQGMSSLSQEELDQVLADIAGLREIAAQAHAERVSQR